MIASATHYVAWGRDLTRKVLDMGLPTSAEKLTREDLREVVYAQEEADLTFRNKEWRLAHPHAVLSPWPGDRVDEEDDDYWF